MKNKPIVIAGNGPSLAQIDYRRLPAEFDVFRSNQFYFEEHYFLGRQVTGAFLNPDILTEQFYTYHLLQERGEYNIQDIYCVYNTPNDKYDKGKKMAEDFPSVKNCFQYLQALPRFHQYERFLGIYCDQKFTSVIWMLITALAQGYTEIYIVGLDFYQNGGLDYAFDSRKPNLINRVCHFGEKDFKNHNHSEDTDAAGLRMAQEMPGVKLYSISESSPINHYVPLAPIVNALPIQPEEKDAQAILDLCVSPVLKKSLVGGGGRGVRFFRYFGLLKEYKELKKTIFFRIIRDTVVLVRTGLLLFGKIIFPRKQKKWPTQHGKQ